MTAVPPLRAPRAHATSQVDNPKDVVHRVVTLTTEINLSSERVDRNEKKIQKLGEESDEKGKKIKKMEPEIKAKERGVAKVTKKVHQFERTQRYLIAGCVLATLAIFYINFIKKK